MNIYHISINYDVSMYALITWEEIRDFNPIKAHNLKRTEAAFSYLYSNSIVVLNAMIFIHKIEHFSLALHRSIRLTVAENAPQPSDTHDTCLKWLQNFTNHFHLRSVFYKGPLLSIIPHISELNTPPALLNPKIYKSNATKALKTIHCQGNEKEWP